MLTPLLEFPRLLSELISRVPPAEEIKTALARPEVAAVLVPPDRADLLELDLTDLTYG